METPADPLIADALALGISLDEGAAAQLHAFIGELAVWNRRMNLTARSATVTDLHRHVLDSLTVLTCVERPAGEVLDIGSGAGFPGIPLKIALPSLRMHLLEASRKKSSFLKHVIRLLELPETQVLHKRVEETLQEEMYRHRFDTVVSRAAFPLARLVTMGAYFLRDGGEVIAMKGPHLDDELAEADRIAATLAMVSSPCRRLVLPPRGDPRTIVIYRKK
jgi:16S rRNA (guanine527-N7)-methyltransferase